MPTSPFPASFGGNGYLFTFAFGSLLAISVFGIMIVRWMGRDLWRDRNVDHPLSLVFAFRFMVLLAGSAGVMRCGPEVAYMTCYGDPGISADTIAFILTVKRAMDVLALPVIVGWMSVLVVLYPFVILALRSQPARAVYVNPLAFWPRLVRPVVILATVLAIAALMALAKSWQMG